MCLSFFLIPSFSLFAQPHQKSFKNNDLYNKWKFGGSFGAGFGSGYTDITLAPSAIYQVNPYFSTGFSLQGSYIKNDRRDNDYNSWLYGGSLILLSNPIPEIQLSAELEQLRVDTTIKTFDGKLKDHSWNTALFLGAGYSTGNVTIGIKYNVLYKEKDRVYGEAYMPFIRMYF